MKELDWFGLYGKGWQNEIVSEAFSHPAKFSRALICRIYEHALERGWLAEGDAVLDPFAGVALGAIDALALGLNWMGNELESYFVDMGRGCECSGISKEDWRRCFGRWKRFAHRDGRHWCPRCLAEAERITKEREAPKPNQTQAKRRKKMRQLMKKTGRNVDFKLYEPIPFPDSASRLKVKAPRLFGEQVPTASYECNNGKIPYTLPHHYIGNLELFAKHARNGVTATLLQGDSRDLLAVLGGALRLRSGQARAQACVSSPPYAKSIKADGHGIDWTKVGPATGNRKRGEGTQHEATLRAQLKYSDDPANLGNMREGDHEEAVRAIVSSPPYTGDGVGHDAGHPRLDGVEDERRASQGCARRPAYGQSAGQLAAMATGDVDAVISSPPFAGILNDKRCGGGIDESKRKHDRKAGPRGQTNVAQSYGQSPGQLAAMPEGAFKANAVVSSPPYMHPAMGGQGKLCEEKGCDTKYSLWIRENMRDPETGRYLPSPNLGLNRTPSTFWSAARQVVQQCWLALAPGGVAIWVLKAFVRNKTIVDFPDQWRRMCEACGFETLEWIRAWLVEDRGAQYDLEGELVEKRVERKSFFRRLAEKKGSPRIDYEVVLVMRKA